MPEGAAVNWGKRLFTKNTGACEVVRRCIRSDACPVPEGYGEGLALDELAARSTCTSTEARTWGSSDSALPEWSDSRASRASLTAGVTAWRQPASTARFL